ncbi:MAG: hypothetical protein HQL22_01250 [Candidatus Omnitrophica bacterium]|nr:hypothetical protein [Candidatus Omnitrophota bacterium]
MSYFQKKSVFSRLVSFFLLIAFVTSSVILPGTARAQSVLNLPVPGAMVDVSRPELPVLLKGLQTHPDNPLVFDFLVSKGDGFKGDDKEYRAEIKKLSKYFLAALAVPENKLWVNLSPFESGRIMDDSLAQTLFGQELLTQDYLLKQLTASMIHPDKNLGHDFWKRVYQRVSEKFGTVDVPLDTFNKVWIVADTATVLEKDGVAYVKNAHLKVMLEQDYLALKETTRANAQDEAAASQGSAVASDVVKEVVIPELEKEVNAGANFAVLRQVFYSFVLASWYKGLLKDSILGKAVVDRTKTGGVEADVANAREEVYSQYLQAYRKGVFNFIREDKMGEETIPHKYFSGGVGVSTKNVHVEPATARALEDETVTGDLQKARVIGKPLNGSHAETTVVTDHVKTWRANDLLVNTLSVVERQNFSRLDIDHEKGIGDGSIVPAPSDMQDKAYDALQQAIGSYKTRGLRPKKIDSVDVFLVAAGEIPLGFALDRKKNRIYIAKDFKIPETDFFVRKVINLMAMAPEDQNMTEQEKETADDLVGREIEYSFTLGDQKDPQERALLISQLFRSPKAEINSILVRLETQLFILNNKDEKHQLEIAKSITGPRHSNVGVRYEDDLPRIASEEVMSKARQVLYFIGVNILDGITNNKKSINQILAGRNEKGSQISITQAVQESIKTAQLSSKFNPITIAHLVITILSTYAYTGVDTMYVNVSKTDPRKKGLDNSYPERLELAKTEIQDILGGLVEILETDNNLDQWNGEEVFIELLEELGDISGERYYTSGQDHDFIIKPVIYEILVNGKPKSMPANFGAFDALQGVNDDGTSFDVTKYYMYYPRKDWEGYKNLVRRVQTEGDYKIYLEGQEALSALDGFPSKVKEKYKKEESFRKQFFDLVTAENSKVEDLENFLAANKAHGVVNMMPQLDVDGKAVLAQRISNARGSKISIICARTLRKEDEMKDSLRDKLIKEGALKILNIEGVDQPIAATAGRRGLIEFLYARKLPTGDWHHVLNFKMLYVHTLALLQRIFKEDPETKNPETLRFLLSQQSGLMTPKSIDFMLLKESEHSKKRAESKARLAAAIHKIPGYENAVVSENEGSYDFRMVDGKTTYIPGETRVRVLVNDEEVNRLNYVVMNKLDINGNPTVELHVRESKGKLAGNAIYTAIIEEAKRLNTITTVIKENGIPRVAVVPEKPENMVVVYAKDKAEQTDAAENDTDIEGGIDFSEAANNINVEHLGPAVSFSMSPAQLQLLMSADFKGLEPEVIGISLAPVSLPAAFGFAGAGAK